jgi:hypothetical protein
MRRHIVGVDPGKINDPTGLVVVAVDDHEALRTPSGDTPSLGWPFSKYPHGVDGQGRAKPQPAGPRRRRTFEVVYIERRPRDESYPQMVRHVAGLLALPELTIDGHPPDSVWDVTGVGQAVADMAREAGIKPRLVSITSGIRPHYETGYWRTPKADLVTAVVVKLQAGELKIAASAEYAEELRRELLGFKVTTSTSGRDSYGAGDEWREDSHDDLVLALCCAVWWGDRARPRAPEPEEYPHIQW